MALRAVLPQQTRVPPDDHLASAFEDALIGMSLITPEGRLLRANSAYCQFVGYTEPELQRLALQDLVHPEDVAHDLQQRALLLAGTKEGYRRERRYLHHDGTLLWGDYHCKLVRDAHGAPLHYITQVQDITARKHAEAALRESEARLRSLCDLSSDWYWENDTQHRLARLQTHGRTPDSMHDRLASVLGRARWEIAGMRPVRGTWDDFRALQEAQQPFWEFEYGALDDPEGLVVSVSGEPFYDAQGQFVGYRGTARDVTRMRRTEWRLREAQVALDQMNQTLEARVSRRTAALTAANAELQAFAYSIAHDLRAPMTSLAGFSRLLEQSIREPQPHQSHYLQRIQQNVQAMSAITDGLLSMAHVNSVELTRATFDVSAASLRALAALRDGDAQRACDFKVQPGMAASGDPALLERVLKNLLSNAWKFSVRRETAFIEVGCEPADAAGMQVFFVRDRGEGFSMAHASRLFNPFQRLHLPTEFNGLGIGLAIVQRCVARHGGKVWAEAAPGQGATFFFSLPAAPQMDDASRWAPLTR